MFDVNVPAVNPGLVAAMEALREAPDAEREAVFSAELKKAHFLAPVAIDPRPTPGADGKSVLQASSTISFILLGDAHRSLFPVFTDWEQLRLWSDEPDRQTLIVRFDDLAGMVLDGSGSADGFIINPAGHRMLFNAEHIAALSGAPRPYTVEQDTQVLLGEPAQYPYALARAVADHLAAVDEVAAVYLMLMYKNGGESLLIVVDCTGTRAEVFGGIAAAATPHLGPGQYIDMVAMDSDFGRSATNGRRPFYIRGIGFVEPQNTGE